MTKLTLFIGDLIIYIEHLTELIENPLELWLMLAKAVRNKIHLQKIAFLYISNIQSENIIENKMFHKSHKTTKYLKINKKFKIKFWRTCKTIIRHNIRVE